jgi:uncharacterized membrane protein YqhA
MGRDFKAKLAGVLHASRYFAVIGSLLSVVAACFLMVVGGYQIVAVMLNYIAEPNLMILKVGLIKNADTFLIALVLLIIGLGIYDLFLGGGQVEEKSGARPRWLKFDNLEQLKKSLTNIIMLILVVTFFEVALDQMANIQNPWETLMIPAGLLMIGGAYRLIK